MFFYPYFVGLFYNYQYSLMKDIIQLDVMYLAGSYSCFGFHKTIVADDFVVILEDNPT